MDIYDALIGAAPSQPDQAALAESLRRRRALGELGVLTGDKVLQSFGGNTIRGVDAQAEALQGIRQKDADNAQTKAYQDAQIKHMQDTLTETRRGNTLDHQAKLAQALAALERAKNSGNKGTKLVSADRTKLENLVGIINEVDLLDRDFKDEYSQKLGPGIQSRLPNALSSVGMGTEGMDEAQRWWAQWAQIYTLPERNRTFGATLTDSEKASWKASDIDASMDPKQIRERVGKINDILKRKGILLNKTYRTSGVDPELMDAYGLPEGEGAAPPAGDDALTPEEQAELEMLEKKYGR